MKQYLSICISILLMASTACANEARDLVEKVLNRNDGTTEVGRVRLTTCAVTKRNKKIVCKSSPRIKVMDMVRKDYGPREKDHKTITIILEPAGEKGIGFLQYDYEQKGKDTDQWLYFSSLGKVKRIVSGNDDEPKTGSFFGSELSYEDMEKRHIEDYTYTLMGKEVYAGRSCAVVASAPTKERAKKSNYSRSVDWIDLERHMILKSILYNRQGKKSKRIYFNNIREISGIFVPMQIVVLNVEDARMTTMVYEKIALNVPVADEFLTQRTLTDGAFRQTLLKQYQAAYRE